MHFCRDETGNSPARQRMGNQCFPICGHGGKPGHNMLNLRRMGGAVGGWVPRWEAGMGGNVERGTCALHAAATPPAARARRRPKPVARARPAARRPAAHPKRAAGSGAGGGREGGAGGVRVARGDGRADGGAGAGRGRGGRGAGAGRARDRWTRTRAFCHFFVNSCTTQRALANRKPPAFRKKTRSGFSPDAPARKQRRKSPKMWPSGAANRRQARGARERVAGGGANSGQSAGAGSAGGVRASRGGGRRGILRGCGSGSRGCTPAWWICRRARGSPE